MTEKEKQQKGMLYQASDPEVLKDLYRCDQPDSTVTQGGAYGTTAEAVRQGR